MDTNTGGARFVWDLVENTDVQCDWNGGKQEQGKKNRDHIH